MTSSELQGDEVAVGSAVGLIGFGYALLTALSLGLVGDITGFLEWLSSPHMFIGPFGLSYALIGQVLIVLAYTGVSEYRNGLQADSTEYAATFLLLIAVFMSITDIRTWIGGSVFSYILLAASLGAYGIITAEGFNESTGKSGLIKNPLRGD